MNAKIEQPLPALDWLTLRVQMADVRDDPEVSVPTRDMARAAINLLDVQDSLRHRNPWLADQLMMTAEWLSARVVEMAEE
jgi:hypothetical protein